MGRPPKPCEANDFLCQHVALLRNSLRRWTGRELVDPRMGEREAARFLFNAPFAVLSHDTSLEPLFNYANQTALNLFAMDWEGITALPSRKSAEPEKQEERDRILAEVEAHGFIAGYSGIRIGRHGRRFVIEDAVVWNVAGPGGGPNRGQAAYFKSWKFL
ncbi:MAG: MEKHLA domain-containing protein [Candidatus Methylumidiphilus sp.]